MIADLTCMYDLTGQEDKDPAFQTICSVFQHAPDTSNRSQVTQAYALLDKVMDPIWFRDVQTKQMMSRNALTKYSKQEQKKCLCEK